MLVTQASQDYCDPTVIRTTMRFVHLYQLTPCAAPWWAPPPKTFKTLALRAKWVADVKKAWTAALGETSTPVEGGKDFGTYVAKYRPGTNRSNTHNTDIVCTHLISACELLAPSSTSTPSKRLADNLRREKEAEHQERIRKDIEASLPANATPEESKEVEASAIRKAEKGTFRERNRSSNANRNVLRGESKPPSHTQSAPKAPSCHPLCPVLTVGGKQRDCVKAVQALSELCHRDNPPEPNAVAAAVRLAKAAFSPFEPSEAARPALEQLGTRTGPNGEVAHLQRDADLVAALCKEGLDWLETWGDELAAAEDDAERQDPSALVDALDHLLDAFSAADSGSEAARTRAFFTQYAGDMKAQRAQRMTAAAAVVVTNDRTRDDAIIAQLTSPESDLAKLSSQPDGYEQHVDATAVGKLAGSVTLDAEQVHLTHNLSATRSPVVLATYQQLNAVWECSKDGPLLQVHDSAPTSSKQAARLRSASAQHDHQVLLWEVELQKLE